MRTQLLESIRTKHVTEHAFIPLCVYDYFEGVPEYLELLKADAKECDPDGFPTIGERFRYFLGEEGLAYRMEHFREMGAGLLGWCQGYALSGDCDGDVTVEEHIDGLTTTFIQTTPIGSIQTTSEMSPVSGISYVTERPLKNMDDVRTYKYIVEAGSVSANYEVSEKQLARIGEAGIMSGAGLSCPFHELLYMFDAEEFLLMSFDLPPVVKDLLDTMHKKVLESVEILAKSPLQILDHEDLWDARQISPKLHAEYYAPYQREYNDILHAHGKLSMDHLSGQEIEPFLDSVEAADHDFIYGNTLEPATMDGLVRLMDRWEGKIVPCIGPSPDFLRRFSADDVRNLVKMFVDKVGGRKLIVGSADAVCHGTSPANLRAVSEALGLA